MATRSTKAAVAVAPAALSTNVLPSPNWSRAMPPEPDAIVKIACVWPKTAVIDGSWTPPAVEKSK